MLRFPNVNIFDPLDIFCDPLKCHAIRNGVMLYRDDDHVSIDGANVILSKLRLKGLLP